MADEAVRRSPPAVERMSTRRRSNNCPRDCPRETVHETIKVVSLVDSLSWTVSRGQSWYGNYIMVRVGEGVHVVTKKPRQKNSRAPEVRS